MTISPSKNVSTAAARLRARHLIAAATVLLATAPAQARSVTPQSVDPYQHTIDCLGVLGTPDHTRYCSPSFNIHTNSSLARGGDLVVPAPAGEPEDETDPGWGLSHT